MNDTVIIIIIVLSVLALFLISKIKKCPNDKVIVKYGLVSRSKDGTQRSAVIIQNGFTFVVPIIQSFKLLDLNPISFSLDLSKELNKRIDFSLECKVAISTEPDFLQNAAERLLGLAPSEISELSKSLIIGELGRIIESIGLEEDFSYRNKLLEASITNIEAVLKEIGLRLLEMKFVA